MSGLAPNATTCYRPYTNGTVELFAEEFYIPSTSTPYGPCCFTNSQYTADNVCYNQNPPTGSTGYYIALCDDPTYKDPSCSQSCVNLTKGDIVWVNNKWYCCGADEAGNANCSNHTDEVVSNVAAPSSLQAAMSGISTATSVSSASSTATTPTTDAGSRTSSVATATSITSSASSSSSTESGLSTGAKAGIGAGVAVLALLAIGVAIFLYMRKSRGQKQPQQFNRNDYSVVEVDATKETPPVYEHYKPPMTQNVMAEADSGNIRQHQVHEMQ